MNSVVPSKTQAALSGSPRDLSSETNKLTSEEVDHLCAVMIRAKKFDEEEALQTKPIEGQLSKYTNVVKGWQYRWFVINPYGSLEYYMNEEHKKCVPRGSVYLAGCQIIPSEEDSQTFTVNAACGEVYKLKAADARSRQVWVNNLRLAAQQQEVKVQQESGSLVTANSSNSRLAQGSINSPLTTDLLQSFDSVRAQLDVAQKNHNTLVNLIEEITKMDENLLLIKATSHAALISLEQCFSILDSIHQ